MSRNTIVRNGLSISNGIYHKTGNGKGIRYGSIAALIFYGCLLLAFLLPQMGCTVKKQIKPNYKQYSPEEWYSLGYLNGILSCSDGKDRLKNGTRR